MRPLSVDILLALALFTEVVCVAGALLGATIYDRLHYTGATTSVAPFLVLAAIVVEQSDHTPTWNAAFVAVVLFSANNVLSHAIARVARQRELGGIEL